MYAITITLFDSKSDIFYFMAGLLISAVFFTFLVWLGD